MGGGASKQAAKVTEDSKRKSLARRRRLLFGHADARPFESVRPRDQFREPLEDPSDLVVQRLGDSSDLRLKFETIQREGDEGFLRDHVLEHLPLDPRLPPAQPILRRLFHLAQAQLLALPRRKLLTCYEVLALYGLMTRGSAEEFLELMFCLFDVDGDDQVGLLDLEATMDAMLQLPEALELPEPEAKEMRTLDARKRNAVLRVLAKKALQDFAADESEEEEPPQVPAEPTPEVPPEPSDKAAEDGEQMSTSSKVAEGFPEPKAKPKGGCCSRQQTPEEKAAKEAKQAEEKLKREQAAKEKAEKAAAEKQRKEQEAKAKAKAKAKGKKGRQAACLCGPAPQLGLSFRQWLRWLLSLELLPPKLEAAAQQLSAPRNEHDAGVATIEPPSGPVRYPSQGGQTPAYGQSPTQSDETPDNSPARGPSEPLLAS